jgi:hypothetical protein
MIGRRHYTVADLLYWSDIQNKVMAVTDAGLSIDMVPPAKKLYLSNDGPNAVYIEFGDSPVPISANTSLKLEVADGLQLFSVQSNKLSAITASGETASLRVGICR